MRTRDLLKKKSLHELIEEYPEIWQEAHEKAKSDKHEERVKEIIGFFLKEVSKKIPGDQ